MYRSSNCEEPIHRSWKSTFEIQFSSYTFWNEDQYIYVETRQDFCFLYFYVISRYYYFFFFLPLLSFARLLLVLIFLYLSYNFNPEYKNILLLIISLTFQFLLFRQFLLHKFYFFLPFLYLCFHTSYISWLGFCAAKVFFVFLYFWMTNWSDVRFSHPATSKTSRRVSLSFKINLNSYHFYL